MQFRTAYTTQPGEKLSRDNLNTCRGRWFRARIEQESYWFLEPLYDTSRSAETPSALLPAYTPHQIHRSNPTNHQSKYNDSRVHNRIHMQGYT